MAQTPFPYQTDGVSTKRVKKVIDVAVTRVAGSDPSSKPEPVTGKDPKTVRTNS